MLSLGRPKLKKNSLFNILMIIKKVFFDDFQSMLLQDLLDIYIGKRKRIYISFDRPNFIYNLIETKKKLKLQKNL